MLGGHGLFKRRGQAAYKHILALFNTSIVCAFPHDPIRQASR